MDQFVVKYDKKNLNCYVQHEKWGVWAGTNRKHLFANGVDVYYIGNSYNFKNKKIYKIMEQYNGMIDEGGSIFSWIYFKTRKEAKNFMDNFLVPYEIAFNLGK